MSDDELAAVQEEYPDHELIVYRNTVLRLDGYPGGVECLIAVPKAKLRELRDAGKQPPFWRKGEVMHVRPAEVSNGSA